MMRFLPLLFCLAVSSPFSRADEFQKQALDGIATLGGEAKVDDKLDEMAAIAATFETATDATLERLAKMPALGSLTIYDASKVTEKGYAALKELPDLQKLVIGKGLVNERSAEAIGTLRTLDTLALNASKLSDVGLVAMKKLVNLKVLVILDGNITDRSVPILLGFKKLDQLNLCGTKLTDAGVIMLKDLEKLTLLRLNNTNVTRKGIDALEEARGKTLTVRW